jgi:hypothetical protein
MARHKIAHENNISDIIDGKDAKTTPVDADTVGLVDSAASNVLKKLTWANIKATLKTYFDSLYGDMDNPMTTAGDVVYGGTSGTPTRLAKGTEGQVLTQGATNPEWADASGGVPSYNVFTSSGTWTKPAGLKYIEVEVVGGGGGGVGVYNVADEDRYKGGVAGGGGGYSKKIIVATNLGATETVTIGSGGDGGVVDYYTRTTSNPTGGGTSSFGTHLSATGGSQGVGREEGGIGGNGSNGDININGDDGTGGFYKDDGPYSSVKDPGGMEAGVGGGNPLAGRRRGPKRGYTNEDGYTGYSYGGGGTGGTVWDERQNGQGGDGANGVVIIKEFF